ncbi:hypothetical protein HanXRQr2_Chr08g0337511 [Helianthus annuus]|uniref:Uncharacterized protein n=1 Tax=Helianthus annuus TaxID=4232 RepID=A0A9K3IEI4_HELAN|nr:hypothetical protein HanXRQr2_Chr08g0337511 [Helianthus annuus]
MTSSISFSLLENPINVSFNWDEWLFATSDGIIGLGVGSFLDLRSWFPNNEVSPCDVCSEAGIKTKSRLLCTFLRAVITTFTTRFIAPPISTSLFTIPKMFLKVALSFTDDYYHVRSAFSLLN